jgi:hypothetical protein
MPLPYVPPYLLLPLASSSALLSLTLDGEALGIITPLKSGPEDPGTSTPLTSLSPVDPMPILSLPVLSPHPPFNQGHPTSPHEDPFSPQTPTALQMSLTEVQGPMYYDQDSQIQGGGRTFIYQPSTTTDLLN